MLLVRAKVLVSAFNSSLKVAVPHCKLSPSPEQTH